MANRSWAVSSTLTSIYFLLFLWNLTDFGAVKSFRNFGWYLWNVNHIDGVMVSVLSSSVVDRGFEPRSSRTKDYKIGICCFSAKHAALRRKSKDWLALCQNNVSEWSDMSTCALLFQWTSTIKIQLSVLV